MMTISRLPSAPAEPKAAYAFGDVIRKYRIRAKYNQRACKAHGGKPE